VSVQGNRGNPFVIARTGSSGAAGDVSFRAVSSAATVTIPSPGVQCTVNPGLHMLGRVRIPAAAFPAAKSGMAFGVEQGGPSNSDASGAMVRIGRAIGQTYTHPGGRSTGATIWVQNDSAVEQNLFVSLWPANNGVTPDSGGSPWATVIVAVPPTYMGPVRATWGVDLPLTGPVGLVVEGFGTYDCPVLIRLGAPAAWAGGAGFTYVNNVGWVAGRYTANVLEQFDLCFSSYLRQIILYDAAVRIDATGTGTAKLDVAARIPGRSCFICPVPGWGAGTGVTYDDGRVYPYDGTVINGPARPATFGDDEFGLAPGVVNRVVGAMGVGANGTVTLNYTERYLGLV